MQSPRTKMVVLVLGMHRSGTSTITRGLAAIGVDLGGNLMPAVKGNNDKGFFEDLDINSLSIEILDSIGHEWDSIRPIPDERMEEIYRNEDFRRKAKSIILSKVVDAQIVGIKNPRVSKIIPFWRRILSELDIEIKIVIACRNPISVAASLQRRNDFPHIKSFYMWLDHNLSSLFYTKDLSRVVVDYDKLIDQPRDQLTRIAKYLGLADDINEDSLSEYESDFIDQNLRHTKNSTKEMDASSSNPNDVVDLYKIMCSMAAFEPYQTVDIDESLQKIRENHLRNTPVLTLFDHSENLRKIERAHAQEKIDELTSKLRLLMEERDTFFCNYNETSAVLRSIQADLSATKEATSNLQEVILSKLETSCRDLERTKSELTRVLESKVYKLLSRFI